MRMKIAVAVVVLFTTSLVAAVSALAAPGSYEVRSCLSDTGRFSSQAFGQSATRGMRIRRACAPTGPGERGLLTGNVVRGATVKRRSRATVQLTAAPGTVFKTFTWSGQTRRTDCGYAIQLYAAGPGLRPRGLKNIRPGRRCPRNGRARVAISRVGEVFDVNGATRIVQRVICLPAPGKRCSSRRANYIKTRRAQVSVRDVSPPSVRITGGSLLTGGWVNGTRTVAFEASDNLGIKSGHVVLGGHDGRDKPRPCDNALVVPCQNGSDSLDIDTRQFAEGTQTVSVQARDGSDLVGQASPLRAFIDNTPPVAVSVMVVDGEAWRSGNGFAAEWPNPSEGDRAPITGASYRICRAGGQCEQPKTEQGVGIASLPAVQVPGSGEWTLRMWRQDAAGNADEANASPPVTLRYDPEAPKLAFAPIAPADPTQVAVAVADPLSGVSGGQIEISREGSGSWQALATKLEGDQLQARIDDAAMPAGRYLLRASASDRAGNTGATGNRQDGSVAVVNLPLRLDAALSGGAVRTRTVRKVVRRKGKLHVRRKRVTRIEQTTRVGRGSRVIVSGTLKTTNGALLASTPLFVYISAPGGGERYAGLVNTDSAGRYRYVVKATSNEQLRFAYLGGPSIRPVSRTVTLKVPAQTTLRASRRRVLNGQRVVFGGRLAAAPIGLASGKLVELQTRLSGRWQTFRTVRTDAAGRWRSAYRFRRTRGVVRYRFRAGLPREAAYPFEGGRTRSIRVTVKGR